MKTVAKTVAVLLLEWIGAFLFGACGWRVSLLIWQRNYSYLSDSYFSDRGVLLSCITSAPVILFICLRRSAQSWSDILRIIAWTLFWCLFGAVFAAPAADMSRESERIYVEQATTHFSHFAQTYGLILVVLWTPVMIHLEAVRRVINRIPERGEQQRSQAV